MSALTQGSLSVGYFSTTESFRQISQHAAVMRADGGLVAVTGPSVGPGAFDALDYASLFAAAPNLLAACGIAEAALELFAAPTCCDGEEQHEEKCKVGRALVALYAARAKAWLACDKHEAMRVCAGCGEQAVEDDVGDTACCHENFDTLDVDDSYEPDEPPEEDRHDYAERMAGKADAIDAAADARRDR